MNNETIKVKNKSSYIIFLAILKFLFKFKNIKAMKKSNFLTLNT